MKLIIDFSDLWTNVKKMGATESSFNLEQSSRYEIDIDDELEKGIEVSLEEIDSNNGLLSIHGRQVLLYIPDQGKKFYEVIDSPKVGKKFHIADCRTLHDMKAKKRFERYKVTNNLKRSFDIYGIDPFSNEELSGNSELYVCRNCLSMLNYKNYRNVASASKTNVVEEFKFDEFFLKYSSFFSKFPKNNLFLTGSGYSKNWKSISEAYRRSRSFTCEECMVNLSGVPRLLHSHHINGNKKQNTDQNLKAVCADCHKKEPLHENMFVAYKDIQEINLLRSKQGLLTVTSWDDVISMSDTALEGVINTLNRNGLPLPKLNYPLMSSNGTVLGWLNLAWPSEKYGISISENDIQKAREIGWTVDQSHEVLAKYK